MPSTPTTAPDIDFFVSYTGKDQAWAEWIAWQLENNGYTTVIQAWDFKSGGVFPHDMHRALQQSARVIAVLTPDYMKSGFCQPEWQAGFAMDPTGEKGILVCVRVADFHPDGLLTGRTYIDLVGKVPDEATKLLLARLKPGRAKPSVAPPHPGTTTAPAFPGTTSTPAPVVIGHSSLDIPSNLPGGYIGRLFLGRDDFLETLRASLLSQTGATAITQSAGPSLPNPSSSFQPPASNIQLPAATSLNGLGGIGKTHAAVAYADRYRGDYTALLFVSGESPERLNSSIAGLCGVLHLDADGGLPPDESSRVAAAVGWLSGHRDWLLIVDNVDDEAAATALTQLLQHLTTGHVLVTSRLHGWPDNVQALDLSVLDPDAATDLLCRLAKDRRGDRATDAAPARRLAELLEGLPLAIQQAAGYINEQRLSFDSALAYYEEQAADLLGWFNQMTIPYQAPEQVGPRPVLFTWKSSFDQLDPSTRFWLRIFAHYAPEPIPEFLLQSRPEQSDEIKATLRNGLAALAQAEKYSLLTRDARQPQFKLHRLVQQIIRLSASENENATALTEGINLIAASDLGNPLDVRSWPQWNPLQAHAEALCIHAPDQPAPKHLSWLLNQLDCLFDTKGLPFEAEKHSRRALAIDEARLGKDHPNVAIRLNNLAALLQATNRLTEAEPLMRRALAIDEASFGQDHPDVAIDLNNLANLLQDGNRLTEAEPLMRRGLQIEENNKGKDHPHVAIQLNNLAMLLQATNRRAEAEPLMRRALAIWENSLGKDHPSFATSLNNLAQLLQATDRLAEAEPLMRHALAIDEATFGKEHPNVAIRLNNLAQLLKATHRLTEAEPLMRRALAIDETSFGKDHPNVARDLNNLATLLLATHRLAEAEPLMSSALAISLASLGSEHPYTQTFQGNLDDLLAAKASGGVTN